MRAAGVNTEEGENGAGGGANGGALRAAGETSREALEEEEPEMARPARANAETAVARKRKAERDGEEGRALRAALCPGRRKGDPRDRGPSPCA